MMFAMRSAIRKSWLVGSVVFFAASFVTSCATDQEDASDLEAQDPVDADDSSSDTATSPPKEGSGEAQPSAAPSAPAAPEVVETPEAEEKSDASPTAAPALGSARRVMYVKSSGVKTFEKPDKNSKVLGKLRKGEHILVNLDGEFARTDDGRYIAVSQLSDKVISPGIKKKAKWSQPGKNK